MLKERIQEVLEFSKSESPYKKANKGWINQDIFLDLSPSAESAKQKNEVAKISLLWAPINNLLSNIFLVLIIGSILVFTSYSLSKGRINLNLFNTSFVNPIVNVEENRLINENHSEDIDKESSENEKTPVTDKKIKSSKIDLSDNLKIELKKNTLSTEIHQKEIKENVLKSTNDIKSLKKNKSKSNFL